MEELQEDEAVSLPYGMAETSAQLDNAISTMAGVLPQLIALSEKEKACELLADEIQHWGRVVRAAKIEPE